MANDLSQGKYRDKAGRERFHGTPALKKSQHFGLDHSIYIALYIVLLLLDIYIVRFIASYILFPHCWILRSQVLSLWLRGESPQSVGAPLGHLSWQKGSPIQTPAIQTYVYQGPVWHDAYGRFVGRCKAMGTSELFVQFETTEARGCIIACIQISPLWFSFSFRDPHGATFWLGHIPEGFHQNGKCQCRCSGMSTKRRPMLYNSIYISNLCESMSNMQNLTHAFFCGGGSQQRKLFRGDRGLSEQSPGFW